MSSIEFTHIRIVGSGLIGTSIGLALAGRGIYPQMADIDPAIAALAQDLVGPPTSGPVELTIIATPPKAFKSALRAEIALNPQSSFIDIGSVKTNPQRDVHAVGLDSSRFLPTHPMAGREIGGATSARADLFESRPWIYCPEGVDPDLLQSVISLITSLGATPIALDALEHDKAVALISHVPQITASALAKQLEGANPAWLDIAGAGLRDTTRIAASDGSLWSEIISENKEAIAPLLKNLRRDLDGLIAQLDDQESIKQFINEGAEEVSKIPGKHGGKARDYTFLPIVIDDKPGQLSLIFDECAKIGVNVEDLRIEHSPEQFTGLVTLALSLADAQKLEKHLSEKGWRVHPWR